MSRATRLLDLVQLLRRHRQPVAGPGIAAELGISLRTLYRDIAALQAQGAAIAGAPGLGYVLKPGFVLPPLMFSVDEVEALVLGSRWVAQRGDACLQAAARNALAKIADVLPAALRHELDTSPMLVGPGCEIPAGGAADAQQDALIRQTIRSENKLRLDYADALGQKTQRTVWPFAMGFFDSARVLLAWCELRQSIRHFRSDRISRVQALPERYPRRRQALLKEWRLSEGIHEP
jgi:predicted DNA-binding transcriptional regulator YafY